MNKKGWLTLLLGLCCFLAGALHIQIDTKPKQQLTSSSQIDSLIMQTTFDFRIPSSQVRVQTIPFDSLFFRKTYRIDVPSGFSKTTFHHHLHHRLRPLGVDIFGEVQFPERDLKLQIVYNNTVHRTIFMRSNSELLQNDQIIPRLPD